VTALAAAGATAVGVVSGAAGLGTAHRQLAALAVPPLVVLVVAAWFAHRRLFPTAFAALVLFGAAALLTSEAVHVTAAAAAFAASLVAAAATFRGSPRSGGGVARLRDVDEATDHVAAPADWALRHDHRRAGPAAGLARRRNHARAGVGLRWRICAQPFP